MNLHICVPLKAKEVSSNWNKECQSLEFFFNSVFHQNNSSLKPLIYLACHNTPEFIHEYKYKDNIFIVNAEELPIPNTIQEKNKDKQTKKQMAIKEIANHAKAEELIAIFDADDLCHSDLFNNIEKQINNTKNTDFVFFTGYMYNINTNDFAYIDGVNNIFYKICGSCIVSKILNTDIEQNLKFFYSLNNHTKFYEICEENNRLPQKLTFPAMLYMHNSVNNLSSGNVYIRQIFKERHVDSPIHYLNLLKFFNFEVETKNSIDIIDRLIESGSKYIKEKYNE